MMSLSLYNTASLQTMMFCIKTLKMPQCYASLEQTLHGAIGIQNCYLQRHLSGPRWDYIHSRHCRVLPQQVFVGPVCKPG